MKVEIKEKQIRKFNPRELIIIIETEEELATLRDIVALTVTIPEAVMPRYKDSSYKILKQLFEELKNV